MNFLVEKPLAWGVMDMAGECLHSVHMDKDRAEKSSFGLGFVVPLNASKLRIKPLEWVFDESRICLVAYTVGPIYRILELFPGTTIWLSINGDRTAFDTEEEAKEAAQKDFNTRILSALESPDGEGK